MTTPPVELTAEEIAVIVKLTDVERRVLSAVADGCTKGNRITANTSLCESDVRKAISRLQALGAIKEVECHLYPGDALLSRNLTGLGGDGEVSVPKRKWERADAMFRFLNYKKAVQEFNEWRAAGMPEKPAPSHTVHVPGLGSDANAGDTSSAAARQHAPVYKCECCLDTGFLNAVEDYGPCRCQDAGSARQHAPEGAPQDRLSRHADIILEAINEYDSWLEDDDYDAHSCLKKIMARMKSRYEMTGNANGASPCEPAQSNQPAALSNPNPVDVQEVVFSLLDCQTIGHALVRAAVACLQDGTADGIRTSMMFDEMHDKLTAKTRALLPPSPQTGGEHG